MSKDTVDFTFELDGEEVTIEVNIYSVINYEEENGNREELDRKLVDTYENDIIDEYLKKDDFKNWLIEDTKKEFERLTLLNGKYNARMVMFKEGELICRLEK